MRALLVPLTIITCAILVVAVINAYCRLYVLNQEVSELAKAVGYLDAQVRVCCTP